MPVTHHRAIHPASQNAPATLGAASDQLGDASVLVIGTVETAGGLASHLKAIGLERVAAGIVLAEGTTAVDAVGPLAVLSTLDALPTVATATGAQSALICLPRAHPALERAIELASDAGLRPRLVEPLSEVLTSDVQRSAGAARAGLVPASVRPRLELSTLIGREPYTLDAGQVGPMLTGKRVLITGAGGSIGSELARIVAGFGPAELAAMDRSENAVFEIDRQLRERHPQLDLRAVLHDVTEDGGTRELLEQLRPDVVFHAAAHKHVPLMEDHPYHAVRNNLFGTRAVAEASAAVGAERFVLVSTDKAVRPSSVMGATKRLAELFVQDLHARLAGSPGAMRCSMVRFGNVLGSAASVLQIWSAQLADGGPITLTDPRMTRYFMTIHEAATLVVQAAAMSEPGAPAAAVNVLDMGEPVRIADLAERFVRAHGFEPVLVESGRASSIQAEASAAAAGDRPAVEIVCTGARPGEKLHEELAYASEHLGATAHPGIGAWAPPAGAEPVTESIATILSELESMGPRPARGDVVAALQRYLPDLASAASSRTSQVKTAG